MLRRGLGLGQLGQINYLGQVVFEYGRERMAKSELLTRTVGNTEVSYVCVLFSYVEKNSVDRVRVLTLNKNRGKGGAIRLGVLCARGKKILMADADGATKFSDVFKLEQKLASLPGSRGIAIGSRAHLVSIH